ncbi:MAG: hypothetical protein LBQ44_09905 [Treponema sp.]|nr:hypothetical protein [Treponema sp.]
MQIGAVEDHRSREGGAMVYPVYSRRSKGLSLGINLFPDRKVCSFDCSYCEVFPFETDIRFDLQIMEAALRSALRDAEERRIPVRDICFSGNGEPTMSEHFTEALKRAAAARTEFVIRRESAVRNVPRDEPEGGVQLVVITNGSGLLDRAVFETLRSAARDPETALQIWLKLDAATEAWYGAMDRSGIPHGRLLSRIRDFAAGGAPFTVQTMLCRVKGLLPQPEESAAWTGLLTELALLSGGTAAPRAGSVPAGLRGVQIYSKARPAPEDPLAEAAPAAFLEERAELLRRALKKAGNPVPVEVFP